MVLFAEEGFRFQISDSRFQISRLRLRLRRFFSRVPGSRFPVPPFPATRLRLRLRRFFSRVPGSQFRRSRLPGFAVWAYRRPGASDNTCRPAVQALAPIGLRIGFADRGGSWRIVTFPCRAFELECAASCPGRSRPRPGGLAALAAENASRRADRISCCLCERQSTTVSGHNRIRTPYQEGPRHGQEGIEGI
jgi:hypothetical protein